ncbi:MAG: FHA domain-containing protein [Desulfurococcales archaeon]|nr:FHA domain-containing protein [Desulfurococcales archaeon]
MRLRLRIVKSPQETPWKEVVLDPPGEYILGRDPRVHLSIPDKYISRRHLRILYKNGKWMIEDLGSKNGTLLDNTQIQGKGPVEAPRRGELVVGLTVIQVEQQEEGKVEEGGKEEAKKG